VSGLLSIEGLAIVSRDGMLAGADGLMPDTLKFEADQKFLSEALDAAALLVHGRMSHEYQPNSPNRRRLLLTRSAGPFSPKPVEPNVWLWNPKATPFADVCAALGIESGVVAILGGTAAYDMFLGRYAKFHLVRAGKVELPGGVPVFSAVNAANPPENVLRAAGMRLSAEVVLDPAHDLSQQTWVRGD
jgi:hypothetical protein